MKILLIAALVAVSMNVQADDVWAGNNLKDFCDEDLFACSVYTGGVTDLTQFHPYPQLTFCTPKGVTYGQMGEVVKKYLTDNPARLHRPAAELVLESMFEAFPCKGGE